MKSPSDQQQTVNRMAARLSAAASTPGSGVPRGFSPAMSFGRHHGPPRPDARQAAVLVLLYRAHDEWHIPLTVRQPTLSSHAGQICLPGGAIEGDESTDVAARREFAEELGCEIPADQILGRLAPLYVFNSNFLVHPWVAWLRQRPEFVPNPSEVAKLLELPVAHLSAPENREPYVVKRGPFTFTAPAIGFQEHRIWGATRVILADCLQHFDKSMINPADGTPKH